MVNRIVSEAEIIAAIPRFNNPLRNWSGLCEAAIWNLFNILGTGGPSSASATIARRRSKIEGAGYGPGNNVVWWSGVWGVENGRRVDFGHVAWHIRNGWGFMASSHVTTRAIPFVNIGFVDFARYEKSFPEMKREGWSFDHAGSTIPIPPAPPAPLPLSVIAQEDDMFRLITIPDSGIVLFGPKKVEPIQTPAHVELLTRFFAGRNDDTTKRVSFYPQELELIRFYLDQVS